MMFGLGWLGDGPIVLPVSSGSVIGDRHRVFCVDDDTSLTTAEADFQALVVAAVRSTASMQQLPVTGAQFVLLLALLAPSLPVLALLARAANTAAAVSYTHLTLPTKRIV